MINDGANEVLADYGEFRFINEVILPIFKDTTPSIPLGDDCAYIDFPTDRERLLVVTTDAAPKPLAWELGHTSYHTWGWYSVLINLSDLAAAGAMPLAFTTSVEAPPSMLVRELRDFFYGMREACQQMGIPNAGGNIRSAPRFECHGTALGTVPKGQQITRGGCRPGDLVYILGESGRFISAYFRARAKGLNSLNKRDVKSLLRPIPKISVMSALREAGVLHSASDNSDSIMGALWNIAERSQCGFEVNLRDDILPDYVSEIAEAEGVNPWNIFFFWGDWQVVVTVAPRLINRFIEITTREGMAITHLGEAIEGSPIINGLINGQSYPMNVLRQENFRHTSYNTNVDEQLKYMLRSPLLM